MPHDDLSRMEIVSFPTGILEHSSEVIDVIDCSLSLPALIKYATVGSLAAGSIA